MRTYDNDACQADFLRDEAIEDRLTGAYAPGERADDDEIGDGPMVQCQSCEQFWHEDDASVPHASDYCVNNEIVLCADCRSEINND